MAALEEKRLGHLWRRAGFGARPDEWRESVQRGENATRDFLLNPQKTPDHLARVLASVGGELLDLDDFDSVRRFWLYRMVHSRRPLEEKMTLFWHNHFATSNFKVGNARWMWKQNEVFRAKGLGSFRTLLQAVLRDAAMLSWLDGAQNAGGSPNENFARELLELFTMGQGNGYTERDIQEAARAFTGWTHDGSPTNVSFAPYRHDDGGKTFLGQTGNFHGDDILDIVCKTPQCARFLSSRLFQFFVRENPTDADLKPMEETYFSSGYDVRAMIETIFTSPQFWSDAAFFARVKSPAELTVTLIRTLDVPLLAAREALRDMNTMGQDLMNPPNVKGWPGGKTWINARTLAARVAFARNLVNEARNRGTLQNAVSAFLGEASPPEIALDAAASTRDFVSSTAAATQLWNAILPGEMLPPQRLNMLIAIVQADGGKAADALARARFDEKLPELLQNIVAAPEYQLS